MEFSRLASSLRPDESEDAIVSSCEKLAVMFRQRPEQKTVFVTQHGFLPLMDLLHVPKPPVCLFVVSPQLTFYAHNQCLCFVNLFR